MNKNTNTKEKSWHVVFTETCMHVHVPISFQMSGRIKMNTWMNFILNNNLNQILKYVVAALMVTRKLITKYLFSKIKN